MTKTIFILANITFILIQVTMFIILLKRYIEEIQKLRKHTEEEIKKIYHKNKETNKFLTNELNYSFKLIEDNLYNQNIILNEINRCQNILEDLSGKKIIRKFNYELINLRTLIYDLKELLYKMNIRIDCDIESDFYIKGDYNLLKEAFTLIIKYYYKNNINITVKKYGNFYNIEFISKNYNKEIENDFVIDYITEIISKHKGFIKIKDKDLLKIVIVIIPLEKKS